MPRSSVIVAAAESKGFSPADIEGLALWLDASDETTITESGGAVSQWDDKSGNGNHVTQGTASAQPTTGTTTINGKNVIHADGDDYMRTNDATLVLSSPYTTFVVVRFTNFDKSVQYVLDSHTDAAAQSLFSTISTDDLRAGAGSYPDIATAIATGTTYLVDWVVNGASSEAKVNGVSSGTVNMGTNSRGGLTLFAPKNTGSLTGYMVGDVAETLEYTGAVSDADRLSIREDLANKWGVTLA